MGKKAKPRRAFTTRDLDQLIRDGLGEKALRSIAVRTLGRLLKNHQARAKGTAKTDALASLYHELRVVNLRKALTLIEGEPKK